MGKKVFLSILVSYTGSIFAQNLSDSRIPFEPTQLISKVNRTNFSNLQQPDFLIDTNITSLPGIGEQRSPAVAFDGTNYLIVYTEYRHGTPRIYGMRVTQDGILLDTTGICISFASESQQNPAVAFDGTNYFVVWVDHRNPEYPPYWGVYADIYGARVSPSGQVLDPDGVLIDTTSGPQKNPTLAFNGTDYLVVWSWGNDLYGRRVSQTGQVLDTNLIVISTADDLQRAPSITSNGTDFFVVWEDTRNQSWWTENNIDIYGARVSQSGILLDTMGIEIIANDTCRQSYPSVSFDGTNYFVVWQDRLTDTSMFDICGSRVNTSGIVIDTAGIAISTEDYSQTNPSIGFNGNDYFITWHDSRNDVYNFDIYGARVSTSGIVIDTAGIAISFADNLQYYPVIASDGIDYLVVWQDSRFSNNPHQEINKQYDIFCTRMSGSGQVINPAGIDLSLQRPADQYCPACAFDNTNYLVVWHEYSKGGPFLENADIFGMRIDQNGTPLDTSAILISNAPSDQLFPDIAFDGANYLVVWEDQRYLLENRWAIYGTRVSSDGTVLDPAGIPISKTDMNCLREAPSIAFDGSNYLVTWTIFPAWVDAAIIGTRVSPEGVVLDTAEIAISCDTTGASTSVFSDLAYGNDDYLVVWIHFEPGMLNIVGKRVSPGGIVLDTSLIYISSPSWSKSFPPRVVFNDPYFLVTWDDSMSSSSDIDIFAARVTDSGTLIDTNAIEVTSASGNQYNPYVGYDGSDYLIVWEDYRNDELSDLYGAKVNIAGNVVNEYVINTSPLAQQMPALSPGANDQILIVYSGWTDSINGDPADVMRIRGILYPFVGIKENQQNKVLTHFDLNISPNPFTRRTKIDFSVSKHLSNTQCTVEIFDITGRLMRIFSIDQCNQDKSVKSVYWDGTDDRGQNLPAGTYFCRLNSGSDVLCKKIIFLK